MNENEELQSGFPDWLTEDYKLMEPEFCRLSGNLSPALFQLCKDGLPCLLLDLSGGGNSDLWLSQNRLHSGKHLLSGFVDQLLRLSQHLADQPFLCRGVAPLRGQTPILVIGDDFLILQLCFGANGISHKLHRLVIGNFCDLIN